jgi:hypothetical protein
MTNRNIAHPAMRGFPFGLGKMLPFSPSSIPALVFGPAPPFPARGRFYFPSTGQGTHPSRCVFRVTAVLYPPVLVIVMRGGRSLHFGEKRRPR